MMKPHHLLFVATILTPQICQGVGVGMTYYLGQDTVVYRGDDRGRSAANFAAPGGRYPSLDLLFRDRVTLQLHTVELLHGFADKRFMLGANVHVRALKKRLSGAWSVTLAPGGSFEWIWGDDFDIEASVVTLLALIRLGFEAGSLTKFGVYLCPGLGPAVVRDRFRLAFSGTLQISVSLGV